MNNPNRLASRFLPALLVVGGLCVRAQAWTTENFESYAYADATVIPNGTTLGAFKYYASNGKGIYFDASGQWGSKGIFRNWDANDGGFNSTDLAFTRSDRSAFDLQSIFLWDDFAGSPNVILRGFHNGVRSYRQVVDPQSSTAGFTFTLNWMDIDSVTISDSTDEGGGADLNTFVDNIVWEAFVPPTATTGTSSSVGSSTASVSGTVNANNHTATDSVQYGTTTGYGTTVVASPATATGTGNTSISAALSGLSPNTLYHWRVEATSAAGTSTGSDATFTTTKAAQTITFANPGTENFGATPNLPASSTSGLTIAFTSSTTGVCTVTSGGALTTVTTGTCTINADQAGNGTWAAAPTVSRSFSVVAVVPGAPTIGTATAADGQATVTFTAPASSGGTSITGYTVTSSPGGLVGTGSSSSITVTGLSNGTAYTFTVTATNTVGAGSASAASNAATPMAAQTITFGSPTSPTYGDSLLVLGGTASSGLTVTYTSGNPAAVRISQDTAYLLAADTATITASQSGDSSYTAATSVSRVLTVSKKSLTIVGAMAQGKVYDGTDSATVTGASLSGVVGSDDVSLTLGTASFGSKDTGTAKPVTVTGSSLSGSASTNYSLVEATGLSANISPRPVTVTARDTSKNMHDADPPLPWSATALVGGDSWTGTLGRDTGEAVGDYPIRLGTLSAGNNYDVTFHGATFTIHGSTALATRPAFQPISHELAANPVRALAQAAGGRAQAVLGAGTAEDGDLSVNVLLPGAASVQVSIFDNLGTLVIAWSQDVSAFQLNQLSSTGDGRRILPVRWNLRASDGEPVPSGVYLWKIAVQADDGQKLETVKRLGVN
ncbi:MAG TPA: YDG domain-containing protein [Fibrobacteria bacterium]|nr:YDG domain-containing protein [Fibrobacteria bacterium]